jgi:hypothetical protein
MGADPSGMDNWPVPRHGSGLANALWETLTDITCNRLANEQQPHGNSPKGHALYSGLRLPNKPSCSPFTPAVK